MSSLDDIRHRMLAAREVRTRLEALRDRAGSVARALDGGDVGLLPPGLDGIATRLDVVATLLEDVCGRLGIGGNPHRAGQAAR
jgi:hypothetical protein